jgi:hypothetical protein
VWDYEEPKLVMVKIFDKLLAHCVVYDPKGNLIGARNKQRERETDRW